MAYTLREQDIALQTIAQQLENIREEDTGRAMISPIANRNFLIEYHQEMVRIICLNFQVPQPSVSRPKALYKLLHFLNQD